MNPADPTPQIAARTRPRTEGRDTMEADSRFGGTDRPRETSRTSGRVHKTVVVLSWAWALVWNVMMLLMLWDWLLLPPTDDPPMTLYPVPLVE